MPIRSNSEHYGQSQDGFNSLSADPPPVKKAGATRFSFTRAELGYVYPFADSAIDRQLLNSMEYRNNHISEESFDRQYQAYRSHSDSDDLDNLVLYNTVDHTGPVVSNTNRLPTVDHTGPVASNTNRLSGEDSINMNSVSHATSPDAYDVRYYSGDPRDVNLFHSKPSHTSPEAALRKSAITRLEHTGEVGHRVSQFEGGVDDLDGLDDQGGGWEAYERGNQGRDREAYERGNHVQNRSLEEESHRPEVQALLNKYQPFSYTAAGSTRGQGQSHARSQESTRGHIDNHRHTKPHEVEERHGSPTHSRTRAKSEVRRSTRLSNSPSKRADEHSRPHSSDRSRKRTRFHELESHSRSDSESDSSPNRAAFKKRQLVQISPRGTRQSPRSTNPRAAPVQLSPSSPTAAQLHLTREAILASPAGSNINKILAAKKSTSPRGQNSLPPLPPGVRRNVNDLSPKQRARWEFQPRSMDDSYINIPSRAFSESSERSSRIDPQVYQSYAAGILHSSHRSKKFQKLQNHYVTLGRIATIEKQTVAKNSMSGKGRFNLVDVRSKSLGSLAPQSQSDNILLSKYKLENVWELKELYADLEEAQDDEEFLFDSGRIEDFQWNPWEDWGIQNKEMSTQQLQDMFERGGNQNTLASLQKLHRAAQLDFRREMSFLRLSEKYQHLDEESRRQKILEEWGRRKSGSRRNSETSSVLSSNMTGSYIELMEKASSRAKQRALYGYHIQEEYNNYEKHVMRMKKFTKSCSDINRLSEDGKDTKRSNKPDKKDTSPRARDMKGATSHVASVADTSTRLRPRSKSEHRPSTRGTLKDVVKDGSEMAVQRRQRSEMGDLLRQELGESTDAKTFVSGDRMKQKWDDKTPPWRSQKTPSPVKADIDEQHGARYTAETPDHRTPHHPDIPRLDLNWGDSTEGEDINPRDEVDRPSRSRSRTKIKSSWRSEVRGVVGNQAGSRDSAEVKTTVSHNMELLDKKLEKFKQRHGWRKDSKPDPGTVSKALGMFQAMEEQEVIPEHCEPLVGDGNPSLGRRATDSEHFSYIRPADNGSDQQPASTTGAQQFQRSKSLTTKKHDHSSSRRAPLDDRSRSPSKLQPFKSEPDVHKKNVRNSGAFNDAKDLFEEMSVDSDSGTYPKTGLPSRGTYPKTGLPSRGTYPKTGLPSRGTYPKTGLPSRSKNTALGRYEARIRSKSEPSDGIKRSRSATEGDRRTGEYDKFQVEQGKYSHNSDQLSRGTWRSKERSLEEHIKSKAELSDRSSNSELSIRHLQPDHSEQDRRGSLPWEPPESPADGHRSRIEMRDDDHDTEVKKPLYTRSDSYDSDGKNGLRSDSGRKHGLGSDSGRKHRLGKQHKPEPRNPDARERSNDTRMMQTGSSMEYVLTRRPVNPPVHEGQSPSTMYETDLDSSRSQPLTPRDGNMCNASFGNTEVLSTQTDSDQLPTQTDSDQLPMHNALTFQEAKTMFEAMEKQPREGTKMAIVTPNTYNQGMSTDSYDQVHISQDYEEAAINRQHRSFSTSALESSEVIDPSYGDLSKWSRVHITDHQRSEEEFGRLQKWGATSLSRATMSSNETFIIRDSDPDASPTHEYSQSFSGAFPSQQYAEPTADGRISSEGEREMPRTISGSLKNIQQDFGHGTAFADREWENLQPQTPTTPIGSALRRKNPEGKASNLSEEPTGYTWKREYDVPPNMDIDDVRNMKAKKAAGLDRSWDVIRNFTREAGPQDFYNDLERLGEEWKRETDKKQVRDVYQDQHRGPGPDQRRGIHPNLRREPPTDQQREPPIDHQREPPIDHQREPPIDHQREPPIDHQRDPPIDHQREPPIDHQREPPIDHQREPPTNQQREPPIDNQRGVPDPRNQQDYIGRAVNSAESRPLPKYRPPPQYVHPWLDAQSTHVQPNTGPEPGVSRDSLNSFHPPNHSTPFTSHSNLVLQQYQTSRDSLPQSKSCPENLTNQEPQYRDAQMHQAQSLAQPQSASSQNASHLPLANTHGMHNEMDRRHGDISATNQSGYFHHFVV